RMETQSGFDAMAYVQEWDAPFVLVEDSQPPFQSKASEPLEPAVEPKATEEAVTNQPETVPPELAKSTMSVLDLKSTEEAVANQPETVPQALPELAKSMSLKATEESISNQAVVEPESDPSTAKRAVQTAPEALPKKPRRVEPEPSEEASAKEPETSPKASAKKSRCVGPEPAEEAPAKEPETSPKALPDPPVTKLPALTRGTPLLLSESLKSKAEAYQEVQAQVITTKEDQDTMMEETGRGRGAGRGRGGRGRGGGGTGKTAQPEEPKTKEQPETAQPDKPKTKEQPKTAEPEEPKTKEAPPVNGERPKKKAKVAEGKATKDQKAVETPSAKKKPAKDSAANASSAIVPAAPTTSSPPVPGEPSAASAAVVASGNPSKRSKKESKSDRSRDGVSKFAHVELSIYWTKHTVGLKPKAGSHKGKQVISVANKKATLAQNIKYAVMMASFSGAAVLEASAGEMTPEVKANLDQMKMDFLGMDDVAISKF
ncbi:unnamed protein product, partial [Symbiodinium sp. CCMP2456]